ncbi:shikimate kinase [Candidatus Enterococcus courvalinii]|uniref:Shikimate kinase n=1 Tax=Candidatus Enterococcus courvalinii TaxID=2815329 RepID=A0ABS3I0R4_9ENTE|nr:shikimate kinase [Enterococcus sp. MSG2901]MBO0482312.1 shikimate kinase [Enterococcus sp. MSG2901]
MNNSIVLVGFMGSGKTTIGTLLAEKLSVSLVDLDELFEQKYAMTIAQYFEKQGEASFRQAETQLLQEQLTASKAQVISTGGGIVLNQRNRALLKNGGMVIFLEASSAELYQRVIHDQKNVRPLARQKTIAEFSELYQTRQAFYEEVATLQIETTDKLPQEIVSEILAHC